MKYHLKKLVVIVTLVVIASCRFYFDKTKDNFTSHNNPTSLQNGKYLTHSICGGCHYDQTTKKFIGKSLNDLPGIGGKLYSANLTQSVTNGIPPKYSDAELFYLLKTGIARNGKFMPYMMKPMMADEDINDIIAYLRSNDAEVAASDTTVGVTRINFLGKMFIRIASKKPTPYNKGVTRPDENDLTNNGRYLVAIVGCYHCHSSSLLHIDYLHPENSKGYMQGGAKFKTTGGKKIRGSNLTPDKVTGIGDYDLDGFKMAIKDGKCPDGMQLRPPMPKFKDLTDKQVVAIYTYLKSLPPVHHKVGMD